MVTADPVSAGDPTLAQQMAAIDAKSDADTVLEMTTNEHLNENNQAANAAANVGK